MKDQWLEEVKEEPTCSKEFAEALKVESERAFRVGARGYLVTEEWLNQHTAKEE